MTLDLPPERTATFFDVMDTASVGVWISSSDGNRSWFNRHWLRLTGRALADETGEGWRLHIHPDDQTAFQQVYEERVRRNEPFKLQYRLRCSDNTFRWLEDSGTPRFNLEGVFLGHFGSASDIQDLKEQEAAAAQPSEPSRNDAPGALEKAILLKQADISPFDNAKYLSILVNGITDYAVYMLDLSGYVISWNVGAQRIKKYNAEQILGKHYRVFFSEDAQQAKIPEKILNVAAREGRFETEDWRVRADGTRFWAHAILDAIHDEDGKLVGFAKVTRDITEQMQSKKLAEETRDRLSHVQKMEAIGQLTGGIAHDFNNLLTIILGNAENLEENLVHSPSLRSLAEIILTAADRGAKLTSRLLAFARRQPLDPKSMDVNQMLASMDGLLRRSIGEQIEIEVIRGGGLWRALVDVPQFESAILNLCINARDAMPSGGKLTIETANAFLDDAYAARHTDVTAGQYVMVGVSDTGVGMDATTLARAFEPFFTTKGHDKGSGLGLSMVYGFAKQLQGHVKLYSEIGHGTTVRLYVPRSVRPQDEAPELVARPTQGSRTGERILLVEDDDLVRLHVTSQLRMLGYEVLGARNGLEAIAVLQKSDRFDLLFTDVVMPGGMTGRQLAEEAVLLRPDLKVLFTSGYTENSIVHHGRLDPGIQLLSKPYRREELAAKVRLVLDSTSRSKK